MLFTLTYGKTTDDRTTEMLFLSMMRVGILVRIRTVL